MHVTQTPGPAIMSLGLADEAIDDEKQACRLRKMRFLAHWGEGSLVREGWSRENDTGIKRQLLHCTALWCGSTANLVDPWENILAIAAVRLNGQEGRFNGFGGSFGTKGPANHLVPPP